MAETLLSDVHVLPTVNETEASGPTVADVIFSAHVVAAHPIVYVPPSLCISWS